MPKVKDTGLTPKQLLFVTELIKCKFNQTEAAINAGYAKKYAETEGSRLSRNVKVREEVWKHFEKLGDIAHNIVKEYYKIAMADITDFIDIQEGGGVVIKTPKDIPEGMTSIIDVVQEDRIIKENKDGSQAIVHDKTKYKLHDKMKALEILSKMAGLLTDKIDLTSNGKRLEPIQFVRVEEVKKK